MLPIVVVHFARFSTNNERILKIITQENVLVGGVFVVSGYVAGYTSTLPGEKKADATKLAKPELFFWQKAMSYYPLHFVSTLAFTPMFVWVERYGLSVAAEYAARPLALRASGFSSDALLRGTAVLRVVRLY